ncbi:MAG: energy-coupling factor transporter transmembrane component T family protein [Fusobacteriaceae bacterium]
MKGNVLGKYIEKPTIFHSLHPIGKILGASLISIISIMNSEIIFFIFLTAVLLTGVYFTEIKLKYFFKGLKPVIYIALFTLFFQILFKGENKTYVQAFMNSFLVLLRFFILVTTAYILTATTAPIELTHGLEDFFSPLKKIKVPVEEMALILSIALRFIPIFFSEYERIKNALASKGWDVEELGYFEKIKFYGHIMIPLLSSAITRSEELANAMEIKGYSLQNKKTRFREYKFKKIDAFFLLFMVTLFLIFQILI